MARFCSNCGSPLEENAAFCGQCGARQQAAPASVAPGVASAGAWPTQALQPGRAAPPTAPPAKSSSRLLKVVVIVLAFFALCTVLAIGGVVYIGYRVKQKAEQVATEIKKETAKQVAQARGESKNVKTASIQQCPAADPVQSAEFRRAASSASIPLKPGLTLVDVFTHQQLGGRDVEVLKTVSGIDENTVTIEVARTEPGSVSSRRVLCVADLLNARQYETGFGSDKPITIAGATMFTMSQAVFQDLKAARPAELEYFQAYNLENGRYSLNPDLKGQLARVEPDDVPYSIIVNGDRKDLPAIHVKGKLGSRNGEAYVLDEPANPITLSWTLQDYFHLNYLKITFPVERKIEEDLTRGRCAAVYGIYFDFDSAKLRPESEPALKEITDALKHNPAWHVTIEGHTDNIGGDAYNVELSTRRAEAVKQALVKHYSVLAERLSSAGFGASRPKAANDTVEGRALNRRVELCRQ